MTEPVDHRLFAQIHLEVMNVPVPETFAVILTLVVSQKVSCHFSSSSFIQ